MRSKEAWELMQASSFAGGPWGRDKWEELGADLQEEWRELLFNMLFNWRDEDEG